MNEADKEIIRDILSYMAYLMGIVIIEIYLRGFLFTTRGYFFEMHSIASLLMLISLLIALIFFHSSIASARLNNFGFFQSA